MAANLRNIKRRIKSVGGIRQITRAMEMVSATKLKKALDRVEHARPYFDRMDEIIHNLVLSMDVTAEEETLHPLMKPGTEGGNALLVAIAADKGLCASFNTHIVKESIKFIQNELSTPAEFRFNPAGGDLEVTVKNPDNESESLKCQVDARGIVRSHDNILMLKPGEYHVDYTYNPSEGSQESGSFSFEIHMFTSETSDHYYWTPEEKLYLPFTGNLRLTNVLTTMNVVSRRVLVLAVGKKVYQPLSKLTDPRILMLEPEIGFDQSLPMSELNRMTGVLTNLYTNEIVSEVHLLYTKYISAARQKPTLELFLPLGHAGEHDDDAKASLRDYIFEPSADELIQYLIPAYARIKIFQALANSFTSEHSTRMTAMRNATDNAAELIEDLTLARNKARQAAITKELSEIVGGAEALKG